MDLGLPHGSHGAGHLPVQSTPPAHVVHHLSAIQHEERHGQPLLPFTVPQHATFDGLTQEKNTGGTKRQRPKSWATEHDGEEQWPAPSRSRLQSTEKGHEGTLDHQAERERQATASPTGGLHALTDTDGITPRTEDKELGDRPSDMLCPDLRKNKENDLICPTSQPPQWLIDEATKEGKLTHQNFGDRYFFVDASGSSRSCLESAFKRNEVASMARIKCMSGLAEKQKIRNVGKHLYSMETGIAQKTNAQRRIAQAATRVPERAFTSYSTPNPLHSSKVGDMAQPSGNEDLASLDPSSPPGFSWRHREGPSERRSTSPPPPSPQSHLGHPTQGPSSEARKGKEILAAEQQHSESRSEPHSADMSTQIGQSNIGELTYKRRGPNRTWAALIKKFPLKPEEFAKLSPIEAGFFTKKSPQMNTAMRKHKKALATAFLERRQDGGKTLLVSSVCRPKREILTRLVTHVSSAPPPTPSGTYFPKKATPIRLWQIRTQVSET